MTRKFILITFSFTIFFLQAVTAQKAVPRDWHVLDFDTDSIYGISLQKAYDALQDRTPQSVVVAVIDSGADTLQNDLKNVLWVNQKEIPHNGIDDDRNGYVDDVHGWNFLGAKNDARKNVNKDSYEAERVYFKYKPLFENKPAGKIKRRYRKAYADWVKSKELIIERSSSEISAIERVAAMLPELQEPSKVIGENFTREDVIKFEPADDKQRALKQIYLSLFTRVSKSVTSANLDAEIKKVLEEKRSKLALPVTPPQDFRGQVVGDNYASIRDKYYGNYNIAAPDVRHGTHVSGIIGAQRDKNTGMNGVADHVKLMQIRAVPDGDEHDKDIALAIRYAVDNGAKIINMSFGKRVSPERHWVEKALRYAERKNVLIVHAAGNDSRLIDYDPNYPTQYYGRNDRKTFKNIITVGASGATKSTLVARFSNFGKKSVDVFAPGVGIYATLPGADSYGPLSGTSMASPVVAGIAGLLKAYFPKLTAVQLKHIIEQSAVKIDFDVTNPATKQPASLSELSTTGGIVNAYKAVMLARQMHP